MAKKNGKPVEKTPAKGSGKSSGGHSRLFLFALILLLLLILAGAGIYFFGPVSENGISAEKIQRSVQKEADGIRGKLSETVSGLQESAGKVVSSSSSAEPVKKGKTLSPAQKEVRNARTLLSAKKYAAARNAARSAIGKMEFADPSWNGCADIITQASMGILRNVKSPSPEMKQYTVGKKETLAGIARKFKTTPEAILLSNKLKTTSPKSQVPAGTVLHIYQGKWSVKVSCAKKRLFLYDGKEIFAVYPVGLSAKVVPLKTPCRIVSKNRKPVWQYQGKKYLPGDPANVLGSCCMEISCGPGKKFRIHGTNKEENVGRIISGPGWICMKNSAVKEVVALMPEGTSVEIIR